MAGAAGCFVTRTIVQKQRSGYAWLSAGRHLPFSDVESDVQSYEVLFDLSRVSLSTYFRSPKEPAHATQLQSPVIMYSGNTR